MIKESFIAHKEEDLEDICKRILDMRESNIFLLFAEMGAGKTAMVKAFLKALGSRDEASSPTFSIVNEYELDDGLVYHFDLYRLESYEELENIAMDEYIYSGEICFIEWPQLLSKMDIGNSHKIEIEILENSSRRINFS